MSLSIFVGFIVIHLCWVTTSSAAIVQTPSSQSVAILSAGTPSPMIMSFKEWKSLKSNTARSRYQKLETEYLAKKLGNPKDKSLKALYNELKISKSYLDDIDELTVSDYFVGYLSGFKDQKKAFKLAAEKLDTSEVAELMDAYADSLLQTSGEGISTSQPGPTTEASK